MYSIYHAVISAAIGVGVVVAGAPYPAPALVAYSIVVGVGIDLDHLIVARLNTGEWRLVRRSLRRPTSVLLDQDALLEDGDVPPRQRLLTHAVLGGAVVGLLVPLDRFLAALTALVLYGHVLADLVADNFPDTRFSPG